MLTRTSVAHTFARLPSFRLSPTVLGAGAVALCAALALAASFWRYSADADLARAEAQAKASEPAVRGGSAAAADVTAPAADFTARLPAAAAVDTLVRDVQRNAATAGVLFVGLDAAEKAPTAEALGRIDVTVLLRGPYAGIKSVLAQVLDRFPNVVLQRLDMKRVGNGDGLDANASVVVLGRPLAAAPR